MPAKKATAKKSPKSSGKDAAGFVDLIHKDKKFRANLKKGWDATIKEGKKRGFKFTKQELHDHLKKKYGVSATHEEDDPDTCICV